VVLVPHVGGSNNIKVFIKLENFEKTKKKLLSYFANLQYISFLLTLSKFQVFKRLLQKIK